jgi:hypothetical protein
MRQGQGSRQSPAYFQVGAQPALFALERYERLYLPSGLVQLVHCPTH